MKTRYEIVWREDGRQQPGRLAIDEASLVLTNLGDESVLCELSIEQLFAVALLTDCGRAPELALRFRDEAGEEKTVVIESQAGSSIVRELTDKLLVQSSARGIPLHLLLSRANEPVAEPAVDAHRMHPGLGL